MRLAALPLALVLALAACSSEDGGDGPDRAGHDRAPDRRRHPRPRPRLRRSRRARPAAAGRRWSPPSPPASRRRGAWTSCPDGDAVVTERDTRRVLAVDRGRRHRDRRSIDEAAPEGEAGLLGRRRLPRLRQRPHCCTSTPPPPRTTGSCGRRYDGDRLGPTEPVLTGIPNGFIHDGGRLAFGPDGYLYASTGETGEPAARPGPGLARRQDPADHPRRRPGARATPTPTPPSGRGGTATCRAWRSTTAAGSGPRSSGRTRSTSST